MSLISMIYDCVVDCIMGIFIFLLCNALDGKKVVEGSFRIWKSSRIGLVDAIHD